MYCYQYKQESDLQISDWNQQAAEGLKDIYGVFTFRFAWLMPCEVLTLTETHVLWVTVSWVMLIWILGLAWCLTDCDDSP